MLRRANKTLPVFRLAARPLASARFFASSYDSSSSSYGSSSENQNDSLFSGSSSNPNQDGLAGSSNTGLSYTEQAKKRREELTPLTVHFSGLPTNATREKFTEALNTAGATGVTRVTVPLNQYTQGSRGFAFVTFDSEDSASKGRQLSVNYDGTQLKSSGARSAEEAKSYRVHIADLSYNTTDADLKSALEQFGPVEFARITSDGGTSRGYGFATFKTAEAADAARKAGRISLDDRVVRIESIKDREPRRFDRDGGRFGGRREGGYGSERSYGSDRGSRSNGSERYGRREGGYGSERSYGSDSYGSDRGSSRGRYGDRDGGDRGYGRGSSDRDGGDRGYSRGNRGGYGSGNSDNLY